MENNSMQRLVVNTLFQEMTDHHNQKDGFRETRKLDPYGKHGVEIRIWSPSQDNTQSWVRISHGANKFVNDSNNNNNNTESPADLPEEQASQLKVKDFAARSKAKAKRQRREPAGYSPRIIPMNTRNWIDIEPGKHSLSAYEISKKVIHLLRHSQTVQREEDGAVQFWRIENYLQNQFPQTQYWSDDRWKACLAAGGGAKRRDQYCTDVSGKIVYFRALQGHSGRNFVDPSLQDNVVIQSGFFQHIYNIGCAFNLHSIINNGLILGGRAEDKQSVFFLPIDPRDKGHKDPEKIDLNVPRRAQYLHSAWKKHQDAVFWVDIDLAIRKGINIQSNSIECNHPSRDTSSLLYSKSYQIEKLDKSCMRKRTCHLDLRPRSLYVTIGQKNWVRKLIDNRKKKLLDSHEKKLLDGHEEKFLDKQNSSNQRNQSQRQSVIDQGNLTTNTKCLLIKAKHPGLKEKSSRKGLCSSDRSGQPDITPSGIGAQTNLSGEIRVEQTHDRSGQPDKHEIALRAAPEVHREIMTLNPDNELIRERIEEDMDFRIPGLPHSTVKQLQSASVQELIQKIENHPNRHALQRDLQQSQSFNPFSQESKQMIHEVGNIELCE